MFYALDFFFKLVGNFGLAILIVTLIIKLVLFPLANKSYVSMSKMKKLAAGAGERSRTATATIACASSRR